MITGLQIANLGWKHVGSSANGGTKTYQLGKELYIIEFNGDNFIYKKDNDPRLTEIEIKTIDRATHKFVTLYKGHPIDIDELKMILAGLNIQK